MKGNRRMSISAVCYFCSRILYTSTLLLIVALFRITILCNIGCSMAGDTCDDGQHGIEIDLVDNATVCMEEHHWTIADILFTKPVGICYRHLKTEHVCNQLKIDNLYEQDKIPNSGPHRKQWAVYGEYDYLPPGRYVHNLEHGGVVFLYHPCTPEVLVNALRNVTQNCTWKYTFSKYPRILDKNTPMAVVTYSCVYKMSRVNGSDIRAWIRKQKSKSPEDVEDDQGAYDFGLLHRSEKPLNNTGYFCPDPTYEMNHVIESTEGPTSSLETTTKLSKPLPTPRNREAAWAVGSLIFLLVVLTSAVFCSNLWRQRNRRQSAGSVKAWGDADGSINVKAVLKKFPNALKKKAAKRISKSKSKSADYHLLECHDDSDEDQL